MKIGIRGKLFLALLATGVTIAIGVVVAERIAFETGFRAYLREREAARLATLAETLAQHWRTDGNFDAYRGDGRAWRALARETMLPERWREGAPGPRPGFGAGSAPQAGFDDAHGPREGEPLPGGEGPRGPPGPPVVLLDAQRRPVAGGPARAAETFRPIEVDGKVVGYLAGDLFTPRVGEAEQRLQRSLFQAAAVILVFALLLAAVAAWVLAPGVLAPLRRLASATHRVASGDYAVRVEQTTRDEVGALVSDFNRLAEALQRTDTQRREVMADLSHELRTPLAILRGELEALEDGIRTMTPERLRSLQAEVATLGKLVDDLYDISLADVGALRLAREPLVLGGVVETALAAFATRLASRGIAVAREGLDARIVVAGDAARLTQVLNNLLENSARYVAGGATLRVALRRERDVARLTLEDSGPGVPDDALPRLFDRLFRVERSRARESGGAGLGLALCRSIVEAHGGTIAARRSALGGLAIDIVLPCAAGDDA